MRQIGLVLVIATLCTLWATPAIAAPVTESPKNLTTVDEGIKVIHNLDEEECIPRLICELAVAARLGTLSNTEATILAIFSPGLDPWLDMDEAVMAAPLKTYRSAAAAGNEPKADDSKCVRLFKKCPFDGQQLRSAFKGIEFPNHSLLTAPTRRR